MECHTTHADDDDDLKYSIVVDSLGILWQNIYEPFGTLCGKTDTESLYVDDDKMRNVSPFRWK